MSIIRFGAFLCGKNKVLKRDSILFFSGLIFGAKLQKLKMGEATHRGFTV